MNFTRAVAYSMMRQRKGRIINIKTVSRPNIATLARRITAASERSDRSNAFHAAGTLAVELASRGVTVNAIAPEFIETDMSEAVRNKSQGTSSGR